MKVLILAAGYGTRLKELGEGTPKALLEVNGQPILSHIVERIRDLSGLTEVIVVTNNKFFSHFKQWQESHKTFDFPIRIVNDGTLTPEDRLGSIGDIEFVLKEKPFKEDLLIVGGDNLFDFNLEDYMVFSQKRPESVTIGSYDIESLEDARKFGVVSIDQSNKIVAFQEKPQEPLSSLVAMCFYFLPKATLPLVGRYLEEVEKSDTAGDYIRWLCEKNDVYGFQFKGSWYDIGSIESYREAQEQFNA